MTISIIYECNWLLRCEDFLVSLTLNHVNVGVPIMGLVCFGHQVVSVGNHNRLTEVLYSFMTSIVGSSIGLNGWCWILKGWSGRLWLASSTTLKLLNGSKLAVQRLLGPLYIYHSKPYHHAYTRCQIHVDMFQMWWCQQLHKWGGLHRMQSLLQLYMLFRFYSPTRWKVEITSWTLQQLHNERGVAGISRGGKRAKWIDRRLRVGVTGTSWPGFKRLDHIARRFWVDQQSSYWAMPNRTTASTAAGYDIQQCTITV